MRQSIIKMQTEQKHEQQQQQRKGRSDVVVSYKAEKNSTYTTKNHISRHNLLIKGCIL